jgi:hypothetical protein
MAGSLGFEPCGVRTTLWTFGGLNPTKENTHHPLFAKKQEISKNQAENKQKCRGWDLNPQQVGDIAPVTFLRRPLSPFSFSFAIN